MTSPHSRHHGTLKAAWLAVSGMALLVSGCGYTVGSPYGPEISSVHVPTFHNDSFRRGFELRLTEAVHKQIQQRTPYRLAKDPGADTRLSGRIVAVHKRVENINRFDDPRELELEIAIEVTWTDLRNGQILAQNQVPLNARMAHAIAHASFAPETGQSMATATQEAVDQLAAQVVGMMEMPW